MSVGSLFAGYGGIDLGLLALGNGVMPQQLALALTILLPRLGLS